MPLIETVLEAAPADAQIIPVKIDRHILARRRWRTAAADGTDLAVDLEKPCTHGSILYATEEAVYVVAQKPENVVDIALPSSTDEAARLGWFLGNQHLPVEVTPGFIRLEADSQLIEKLKRAHIHFHLKTAVFSPSPHSSGHAHGAHHPHQHSHAHTHT